MISLENIKNNWKVYSSLCKRLSDTNIDKMIKDLDSRIVSCPASLNQSSYGAYEGGLVEHAIMIAKSMKIINESMKMGATSESILKVALFHEIGKVGSLEGSLFIEQDSEWHREKLGQMYKYNESIQKSSPSHRSLYLLQHFNVCLSQEEWIAIQLSQGSHFEENRFYVGSEPTLAILLQNAKSIVIHRSRQ
jgi:hypothetical protein|tara:strand:- start:280 stop:855 length:576 start_codon:yes stop_codon:yes gene_type:complete